MTKLYASPTPAPPFGVERRHVDVVLSDPYGDNRHEYQVTVDAPFGSTEEQQTMLAFSAIEKSMRSR